MSDLISRSELLESFRKSYCGHLGMENSDGMITFRSICRIINKQPTAYSVDKVVRELEERKEEREKQYKTASMEDGSYMLSKCFSEGARAYDNAIEIVKQGCVSDDLCECRLFKGHKFLHKTSCGNVFDMQKGFKYCPYCGKKIKMEGYKNGEDI